MGWPFTSRDPMGTPEQMIAQRTAARTSSFRKRYVARDDALRHSAVWACLRLRADLLSTMPLEVYRQVGSVQVDVPTPPVLQAPGGSSCGITEWLYSTQFDLDSSGNTFGLIKQVDGMGLPAIIELLPLTDVTVTMRAGVTGYKVAGTKIDPSNIWHEKQFTISGMPVGLSPIAYAASSITGYLSAQQFAADWFSSGGLPAAHLKNSAKKLDKTEANNVKAQFKASVASGDVFVSGNDWDYSMLVAKASELQFLDERRFGITDISRYLGVPADMIDADTTTGTITYANVTQRNLQLLIMNLNPAVVRRESAFSQKLLPKPRLVKFNTDYSLLRMDPKSRYEGYKLAIDSRWMVPSEIRGKENLAPFTPEQEAEFARLFPKPLSPNTAQPIGAPS